MSHLVIVGGSKGIGREAGRDLRRAGHRVTTLPRSPHPATALEAIHATEPINAIWLCQRFRGEGDDWEGEIAASLTYTKHIMEWVATHTNVRSVVVMSSVAAVSVEEEQPVSYHMAKAALTEMVRYYAVSLGRHARVNAIIPGLTPKEEAWEFYQQHKELTDLYRDITPIGRVCRMEDIANLVDFLISEKSSYMTGQTLTLDGGIGLRSQWNLARRVSPNLRDLNVRQRHHNPPPPPDNGGLAKRGL